MFVKNKMHSQCQSRRFLKEFCVPANSLSDGKLLQLFNCFLFKNRMSHDFPCFSHC